MARLISADPTSTWRRLVTDPLNKLINYGRTRYPPPPDLADYIRARDQVCTFPNCHHRAITCELDHVQPGAHGRQTNPDNLIAACPRHHHLKHNGGWTNHYNPTTATLTWTSPTNHTYTNPPPDLPGNG
jgi:5-methylcytosine-specific restriction endonuclease McrA